MLLPRSEKFETAAQRVADFIYMLLPRRRPSRQALLDCRIVSHRGEHDNDRVRENTLPAFERAFRAGVWGLEFDVRWTRDLQPVVIHDTNTKRVFGSDLAVAAVTLDELQQRVPEIPSLAAVVDRFGGRAHLMVELKRDDLAQHALKGERLRDIFSRLVAGNDYHIIALQEALFELAGFAGDKAFIPVAERNIEAISELAITRDLAGICGQYFLLNRRLIERHRERGQHIGTGFIGSRFCFYRELNRGVDWIFTDHALKLGAIRQRLLRDR